MPAVRDFKIERNETWKRLVVIRDRRTRRRRVPTEAKAALRIPSGKKAGDWVIPTTIIHEGAVQLHLTPAQTKWLPAGTYDWDMSAMVTRSPFFTSTTIEEVVVVRGTLTVSSYDAITDLDIDLEAEEPLEAT